MFAPLARVRNFDVKYLDAFINMYPNSNFAGKNPLHPLKVQAL